MADPTVDHFILSTGITYHRLTMVFTPRLDNIIAAHELPVPSDFLSSSSS